MHRAAFRRFVVTSHRPCVPHPGSAQWVRRASSQPRFSQPPPQQSHGRTLALFSVLAVSAGATWYLYPAPTTITGDEGAKSSSRSYAPAAEVEFEKQRKQPVSSEENKDLLSSQHLQVKKSWENPGVYAWGSNTGRVVAPESSEAVIKAPRRIPYFDGQILRDLKLDRNFGVAVTEEGDIVQWGNAFSPNTTTPIRTLAGKDIAKVAISSDRIMALSKGGDVYSLPVSRDDQQSGARVQESSWIPFWSSSSPISYRTLRPKTLGWGEKVIDISCGLDHCLLLTNQGRLFSAAASTENFPTRGQLGISGLNWYTKPAGRYDQLHEIKSLPSIGIAQIATGSYHSLALDKSSRVFAWGDNSSGQLGFELNPDSPAVDAPTPVPLQKLYSGSPDAELRPRVTSIAAGGSNSYFTIDSAGQGSPDQRLAAPAARSRGSKGLGRVTADVWACGAGIHGGLGTGKWTHISSIPTRIKALSGLFEYDDATQQTVPIRLARLSAGSTHAAATMANITSVVAPDDKTKKNSPMATSWGSDVLWWGSNEFFQLGTGKRSNLAEPSYIPPLDGGRSDADFGRKGEFHRLQIAPKTTVRLGEDGQGRKVCVEQRVECGRHVTAVYSATAQQ